MIYNDYVKGYVCLVLSSPILQMADNEAIRNFCVFAFNKKVQFVNKKVKERKGK